MSHPSASAAALTRSAMTSSRSGPGSSSSNNSSSPLRSGTVVAALLVLAGAAGLLWRRRVQQRRKRDEETLARELVLTDATRNLFQQYESLRVAALAPGSAVALVSDEVIARRVWAVSEAALKVHSYRCIEERRFMEPRIALHPLFWELTKQEPPVGTSLRGGTLPAAIAALPVHQRRLLDVGCCFGTDLRSLLVADFQPHNVLGLDIQSTFIDLGLDHLFLDRALLQSRFVTADFLDPASVANEPTLSRFLRVEGGAHILYAGSVFHLLNEQDCLRMAQAMFDALVEGGVAFGRTVGLTAEGGVLAEKIRKERRGQEQKEQREQQEQAQQQPSPSASDEASSSAAPSSTGSKKHDLRFLHTAASLTALLESVGFTSVVVTEGPTDMNLSRAPLAPTAVLHCDAGAGNKRNSHKGFMAPGLSAMLSFTAVKPEI